MHATVARQQSQLPVLPAEELEEMNSKLKAAKEQVGERAKALRDLQNGQHGPDSLPAYQLMRSELQSMEAAPKTKDLEGEIKRVRCEVSQEELRYVK